MTPDFKPTDCKVYPLTGDEQKALEEFLDENLRTKRIRPSKSPMASPFFFVKKKDGKLRPVQDYRKLNEMTIKNRYPLPLIKELVDHLKGSKIFMKLDVQWGYNNIRIKEGDKWKAAFDEPGTVQTNSHVLRINELACNIPVDNGPHLPRPHQHWQGLRLYR